MIAQHELQAENVVEMKDILYSFFFSVLFYIFFLQTCDTNSEQLCEQAIKQIHEKRSMFHEVRIHIGEVSNSFTDCPAVNEDGRIEIKARATNDQDVFDLTTVEHGRIEFDCGVVKHVPIVIDRDKLQPL